MRIVSLLPSTTEIACALDLAAALVGRSHECDFPPDVAVLPACTAPKFEPDGTSREIDTRVRDLVERGLSVYRVDADRLRALAPDVILTQSQCEVCAASERDVEEALATWLGKRPRVLSLAPATLADVWAGVARVAAELGVAERGRELARILEARTAAVAALASGVARPGVALIEWVDPLMSAGNWMPEMVAIAGGRSLFGEHGKTSPWLSFEALAAHDPEVIVAIPCGFGLARSQTELALLARDPRWPRLRAVRGGRVFAADGNAWFNRPGPRLAESAEILAEILHPERFGTAFAGRAYARFASG